MAKTVGVRTAAGGLLSLPTTPADVIGRCDTCRLLYREGDWYCDHLGARFGHPIARLEDQSSGGLPPAAERAARGIGHVTPAAFTVTFESPGP